MNTGGSWNGVHSWASPTTETINGSAEYHYKLSFDTNSRIAYRTIDKTWYDADTSSQPTALSSDAFSTQSSALVNPQYVWIGDTSATNTDFYLSFDNPYYEAPAYRTGTSQNVNFSGGTWSSLSYSLLVDDTPSSASSGITLSNGDKAWDFDLVIPGYGNVNIGEGEFIRFIAGPTVGTGVWSKGTDYDAVRDTTDTDKINFINPSNNNLEGMLYESSAFVDGLVPYGDIP